MKRALMERDGLIVETHHHAAEPSSIGSSSNNSVRSRPIKLLPDARRVKPLLKKLTWLKVVLVSDGGNEALQSE